MKRTSLFATALVLMLLPGCGQGETAPGQPSADERAKLDNMARRLEQEQGTFDTSPDSLVPAGEGMVVENGAALAPGSANGQAPPASNGVTAR